MAQACDLFKTILGKFSPTVASARCLTLHNVLRFESGKTTEHTEITATGKGHPKRGSPSRSAVPSVSPVVKSALKPECSRAPFPDRARRNETKPGLFVSALHLGELPAQNSREHKRSMGRKPRHNPLSLLNEQVVNEVAANHVEFFPAAARQLC